MNPAELINEKEVSDGIGLLLAVASLIILELIVDKPLSSY